MMIYEYLDVETTTRKRRKTMIGNLKHDFKEKYKADKEKMKLVHSVTYFRFVISKD